MNAQGKDGDGNYQNKSKSCTRLFCYYHHVRNHIPIAKVRPTLSLGYTPYNATCSAWFAFFIPCYGTFKTLSNRPISESELQKWAMYWSVIGAFVAFEYVTEWFISWYALFSRYQLVSDSSQKGAILLGSKDFVLVVSILATDTG
jgi:hypothetical protein